MPLSTKSSHLAALVKLSKASRQYPRCLALRKEVFREPESVNGGSFGEIFRGHYQGHVIALKVLRIYKKTEADKILRVRVNIKPHIQLFIPFLQDVYSEAIIWKQLVHPNILPFFGIFRLKEQSPKLCLAAPWMENGDVTEYLSHHPNTNCVFFVSRMGS